MFPVHYLLAKWSIRAEPRDVPVSTERLLQELTEIAGLVAADPIDRDAALSRLSDVMQRISRNGVDWHKTEIST
jgi:hypothetical protein